MAINVCKSLRAMSASVLHLHGVNKNQYSTLYTKSNIYLQYKFSYKQTNLMQCWHTVSTALERYEILSLHFRHFSDLNVLFTCFTCILIYLLYLFNCILLDFNFVESEIYIVFHLRQQQKCTCAALFSIFNAFTQTLNTTKLCLHCNYVCLFILPAFISFNNLLIFQFWLPSSPTQSPSSTCQS